MALTDWVCWPWTFLGRGGHQFDVAQLRATAHILKGPLSVSLRLTEAEIGKTTKSNNVEKMKKSHNRFCSDWI